TIESNRAAYGGGIGAYCSPSGQAGSLTITDCPSIADNQAGRGGGIYCNSDAAIANVLTITNSVISGNSARSDNSRSLDNYAYGGGVYALNCQVEIVDSTVSYNRIFSAEWESYGTGLYCYDSSLLLENSILSDNEAEFGPSSWDSFGGGLHFQFAQGPALTIDNCTIIGNSATKGGGMYCQSNGSVLEPEIVNSLIASNRGNGLGGGIYFRDHVDGLITNSRIVANEALSLGGGIELDTQCEPTIVNCLLAGNSALYGDTDLTGNGGAIDCFGSSPTIVNCTIAGNLANIVGGLGGGIYCESQRSPVLIPSNPTIINCLFADNDNHAIYESDEHADPNVSYCHFYDNEPNDYGDYYDFDQDETFTGAANLDSIADGFVANSSDGDPSFAMYDPERTISGTWKTFPIYDPVRNRTTLVDFTGSFAPGGLVGRLINPNTWQKRQVLITANTDIVIEVVGNVVLSLGGYVERLDPYMISDYRLQIVSVCSDAGDSTAVVADSADLDDDSDTAEHVPYDLAGLPRIIEDPWHVNTGNGPSALVDIGAYEIQVPSLIVVDKAATGANNGRTWDDALNYFQDAIEIADASNGGINQVQVAQGTYSPDEGVNQTTGNRSASFRLIDGVKIRGGYIGIVSADPNTRDIRRYPTVLSGDLN
ncbi:MAG: right-handed parallel beta-helix repeat-containing protein, partial [Planctomycetes bacterium]|nr:right-handed parallel beta-helix repeat-containing protein [Planctomycetota bacterium]